MGGVETTSKRFWKTEKALARRLARKKCLILHIRWDQYLWGYKNEKQVLCKNMFLVFFIRQNHLWGA